MDTNLSRELVALILQFLNEEKFSATAHMLEQESGCYFNMKYFEEQVLAGKLDDADRYLSGFTRIEDNRCSMKIFFHIRKQKYLEALDRKDHPKAVEILVKDLKVFKTFNKDIYDELTQLLTLKNFRENEQLSMYGDATSARKSMLQELGKLIEDNPRLHNKLAFPRVQSFGLRNLINQSINWQHQHCKNQRSNPDIKTLFVDHECRPVSGPQTPTNSSLMGVIPQGVPFLPIATPAPFQHEAPPSISNSLSLTGRMVNPNPPMPHSAAAAEAVNLYSPQNAGFLTWPRNPPASNTGVNYQCVNSEHVMKRSRIGPANEVTYTGQTHPHNMYSQDDLPVKVARSLNQGSKVISMDFHPQRHTVLLVGTSTGDIGIWDVGPGEKLSHKTFGVWDVTKHTMNMQATCLVDEPAVSVNRCIWSPNGESVGVAFSKCIIHTYSYIGAGELRPHLEINAHIGGVNDIAFTYRNKQLFVITCGDDKSIKVWDALTGHMQYVFEGHEAPVYCIFPHQKDNIQIIFSTATDGKIKAWLYDHKESIPGYDAPGKSCTTIAYSSDGSRLFSCGTSKSGKSYLVEWNESDGAIKRTYSGFQKRSFGVVQFDTRNRLLAAGDDNQIKFWDMDNVNILSSTDVEEGCLEASPHLRFNKDGSLLAVTTKDNGIKILANADGLRLLDMLKNGSFEGARVQLETLMPKTNVDNKRPADVKERPQYKDANKIKNWKLAEVSDSADCRSCKLPDPKSTGKIVQLLYTNSGSGVVALDSNAVHKLWKWTCNEWNPTGKATINVPSQLAHLGSDSMTNDLRYRNPGKAISCIALSNNDQYLLSASGGVVSLINMITLKNLETLLTPSPAATVFAFYPKDNNIIAFGLEDKNILIFYLKLSKKMMLEGHQKKITGLAFSLALDLLISAGADALLCAWSIEGWEKQREKFVSPHKEGSPSPVGISRIQFHKDQVHLLVVQESQLAIYDASRLERVCNWEPKDSMAAPISNGTYSCDSHLVYASFCDGAVGVFDADVLTPCCHILPSAFLPSGMRSGNVYPLAIAAHPLEPHQFAIGLTDGDTYLIEPSESQGKRGVGSLENGSVSSDPAIISHDSESQG